MKLELLKNLCDIPGLSGHEDAVIRFVLDYVAPLSSHVHTDNLGNVTVTFPGTDPEQPSIAFFAHMDEIGMMVRKVEESGYLRIERVGGVPERALVSRRVDVHTLDDSRSYPGIFGITSHHITPADKKYAVATTAELYLDIGCASRQEVLDRGIDVGSVVTYAPNFLQMGDQVYSKALDDRMGIYNLLEMVEYFAQHPPKGTVYLIFTVQEEFNIRSATPTFNRLKPDLAICIDITPSCDTPETVGKYDVKLGRGPAIMYMNFHGRGTLGGLLVSPRLNTFLESVARENGIPTQKEVVLGVITDDAFTQHCGDNGIVMGHLSIPLRYTHSPAEAAHIGDIDATTALSIKIAESFTRDVKLTRG